MGVVSPGLQPGDRDVIGQALLGGRAQEVLLPLPAEHGRHLVHLAQTQRVRDPPRRRPPRRGARDLGRPKLTEQFEAFRGTLGIRVIQCRPRDPEAKGLVERANGYLERSSLPGRTFASPADFNAQLEQWLQRANSRQHRALGCRPADRLEADRAVMLTLPPVALLWPGRGGTTNDRSSAR